jgi:hypothetical protein
MVLIANNVAEDKGLRLHAAKELVQYVYPKMRAVEVAGDPEQPVTYVLKWQD